MRRTYKITISLCVALILVLSIFTSLSSADPLSIAIGVGGASGAGLFGSMASASGINIGFPSNIDPTQTDVLWNDLNPGVTLDYRKGQKTDPDPVSQVPTVYDYIQVDIGDWLRAQRDFIDKFVTEYQVDDNDSGTVSVNRSYAGYSFYNLVHIGSYDYYLGSVIGTVNGNSTITLGRFQIVQTTGASNNVQYAFYRDGYADGNTTTNSSSRGQPIYAGIRTTGTPSAVVFFRFTGSGYTSLYNGSNSDYEDAYTSTWSSGTVDTDVFDDWNNPTVKIPASSWSPSDPINWNVGEFLEELTVKLVSDHADDIILEDDNGPVPPAPVPDTPLGDVPFDDWVDLWGQSIWEQLTRIEEKQELMVIGQEDGLESLDDLQGIGEDLIEDVDDIIGLETDINENLEDMITYEQGISEDVEDIGENVEDIEDEVIVIVDEMGNVIDVLEGIDAKIYAQGQTIGSISTEVGTVAETTEDILAEVEAQAETQEDIKEAVEDLVPYVAPLPDIASDTETMVDILPDIATATETATQTLTDTLPDIKDATQTLTDTLPDVITEIQDATTTLTDTIPNIDDICLNIDEAPYKDIDTGLDRLPRFLLPFITDLRSALGIWHYVTEWLAQISTTFAFISGCLVGTSIMTPIYAAIAGFMCIKVYRRMTS